MEIAVGVVGLVHVATATSLGARKLCETWKDAPRDIHYLRDELDTCEAFLNAIRTGIVESSPDGLDIESTGGSRPASPTAVELARLLSRGNGILGRLQEIVYELVRETDGSAPASRCFNEDLAPQYICRFEQQRGRASAVFKSKENHAGVSVASMALLESIKKGDASSYEIAALVRNPATMLEEDGFTELHRALAGDLLMEVSRETLQNSLFSAQVNSRTAKGLTPLHIVAMRGPNHRGNSLTEARLLLDAGAEIDAVCDKGYTPLGYSCHEDNAPLALALLEAGASAGGVIREDLELWRLPRWTPLHLQVTSSENTGVVDQLIAKGACVDGGKTTPLMLAANWGNLVCVQHLTTIHGANPNLADSDGDTPLYTAIGRRRNRIVRFLLACGETADEQAPLNNSGRGVLHVLAIHGDRETIEIMTEAYRNGWFEGDLGPYRQDNEGKTAIDYLRERPDYDDDLGAAFQALLDSVIGGNGGMNDTMGTTVGSADEVSSRVERQPDEDEGGDQEFYDAFESLEV
ncbi:ankyrin repeat-containing domain protein [Cercophora newfieldiana]|uniref:Ankyrin repeat-containing domain protein n=1 Tax=Cercophora newfieldiana TaxID=92897 RepID=A0AA39Y1E6_9PEZI|nr:ankyrin repeat-containing domain protein [Cercophora newfieldiana]